MEIKFIEEDLFLEDNTQTMYRFSDNEEYKKILILLTDPENKEEIENMDLPESEDIRIKILKKYQERILSIQEDLWIKYALL